MSRVVKSVEVEICGDIIVILFISVLFVILFNLNLDWLIKGKCRKVIKSVLFRIYYVIEII